ncbi:hypothetical protein BsIDN1_23750 [Bacillus safensis]|uniref:Uncharacterized protein n=1 Tax=Bacillus safensis TaxID=561879 RepID=A0A5S9M5H2_BACIA|nr:hypothetical protein BsIDN1_23750 [Bacillus safensis]
MFQRNKLKKAALKVVKGYVDDVDLERKKKKENGCMRSRSKKAALNIKYMSMQKLEKR